MTSGAEPDRLLYTAPGCSEFEPDPLTAFSGAWTTKYASTKGCNRERAGDIEDVDEVAFESAVCWDSIVVRHELSKLQSESSPTTDDNADSVGAVTSVLLVSPDVLLSPPVLLSPAALGISDISTAFCSNDGPLLAGAVIHTDRKVFASRRNLKSA